MIFQRGGGGQDTLSSTPVNLPIGPKHEFNASIPLPGQNYGLYSVLCFSRTKDKVSSAGQSRSIHIYEVLLSRHKDSNYD